MRKVEPLNLGDDFTVDDDIQLDAGQVDEIFARCLNKGAKSYLDRLERLSSHEIDFGRDEGGNLAVAFEGMRKFIAQKKSGYQSIKVADFHNFGIPVNFISKIRYLVHRLDTASPRLSTNRGLSLNGRRLSTMTTSSVQDDCDDDYGDDFEDDEEDYRGSFGSDRKSLKRESRASKEVDDEILDIIDEEEEEEEDENGQSEAAVAPFTPYVRKGKAPESPTKYNRPNLTNSFSVRPNSGSGNTDSSSMTIITSQVNPSGSAVKRYGSAEKIRPKVDIKYDSSKDKDPRRAEMPPLSPKRNSSNVVIRSASTSSVSMSGARASNAGLRRRVKNSTWINEGNWKLGEKIGTGSFGEVFKAMNDKGKLYAVKRLNMVGKLNEVEDLTREIELMKDLEHANIVGYVGAWVNEESGLVYIFQEWACGGSVAHLLKQFGPFQIKTIKNYTKQILLGLSYLHDNGIIHRDIKGGNVLIDTDTVKLADFGASTKMVFGETQSTSTVKGTPYFMAPETLSQSKYGRKGDIWAVGCTVIQMLTGEPPWKEKNLNGLVQLHLLLASWVGPPDYDREVPVELKECLEMCFAKEAEKRPTASELLQCSFLRDNLDESSNFAEQLGFSDPPDQLDNSGIVLHDQIARAVTRHSFCAPDKPGGSHSVGGGIGIGIGARQREVVEEDSTMGGIDRQILQREKMKLKAKEVKANELDRERESNRERERGYQPHYQLNMPSGRGVGAGGYSPYSYETDNQSHRERERDRETDSHRDRDRDRCKDIDSTSTGADTYLSPKDIAEIVSQSSSQSANNPFAKGASPFSSNKKITSNSIDSNSSRNSPHPVTPARGRQQQSQSQIPDKVQVQVTQIQSQVQGLDIIGTRNHNKKPVHAFSDENSGNVSAEEETERNGNGNGNGNNYRNRVPYHDSSPGPARNPFHTIVEEAKSGIANTSRSLPSSPVMFPTSRSPSVLSSPEAASIRNTSAFKEDRFSEKSKNNYDSDNYDSNRHGGYEKVERSSGYGKKSVSGLSASGGNPANTNGELIALKRRTAVATGTGTGTGNGYSGGGDVGSGLDCDADYEEDDRREKQGRYTASDRRHDSHNNHSGRGESDHIYEHNSNNSGRSNDEPTYRHFQGGDDEDGEEPELDIIRTPAGSNKSGKQRQQQQQNQNHADLGRILAGSNSNSTFFPTPKTSDHFIANPTARMIHSASLSRVRPPVAATARRPATTATGKTPAQFAHATIPRGFSGGPGSGSGSGSNSARAYSRDTESGDDNEGYGHGYRCDNVSSKSAGRAPSGSVSGERAMRSKSKEPTQRASPPVAKRETGRQRDIDGNSEHSNSNSNSNSGSNSRSNAALEYEEDEGKWSCPKCGHDNTNQYHCDHCATKRTAYSFAPENIRMQRQMPR